MILGFHAGLLKIKERNNLLHHAVCYLAGRRVTVQPQTAFFAIRIFARTVIFDGTVKIDLLHSITPLSHAILLRPGKEELLVHVLKESGMDCVCLRECKICLARQFGIKGAGGNPNLFCNRSLR